MTHLLVLYSYRYGAGEAFYGPRTSDLSEDEFQDLDVNKKKQEFYNFANKEMKDNAILIVGDSKNDVLQWISLELLEKGFTVRVVCDEIKSSVNGKTFLIPYELNYDMN